MPDETSSKDPLDHLLRRCPLQAPADLAQSVCQRLQEMDSNEEEAQLEEWLDDRFGAWSAETSAHFTDQALEAILGRTQRSGPLIPWHLVPSLAAGLAACIALVWALPPAQQPHAAEMPSTRVQIDPVAIDPSAAEILLLAEGLELPARWLLDEAQFVNLVAASE
jgi:hypothetical protein